MKPQGRARKKEDARGELEYKLGYTVFWVSSEFSMSTELCFEFSEVFKFIDFWISSEFSMITEFCFEFSEVLKSVIFWVSSEFSKAIEFCFEFSEVSEFCMRLPCVKALVILIVWSGSRSFLLPTTLTRSSTRFSLMEIALSETVCLIRGHFSFCKRSAASLNIEEQKKGSRKPPKLSSSLMSLSLTLFCISELLSLFDVMIRFRRMRNAWAASARKRARFLLRE